MNTLRLVLPLAALLVAAPALAQPANSGPPAAGAMDQAAMHEKCKAVMGHQMDARHPHEHSMDKQGMTTHARGVPPTKAEMEKMHAQCAEMMAKTEAPPAKK